MKNFARFLALMALSSAASAASAGTVIKTCNFVVQMPGEGRRTPTEIQISQEESKVSASITEIADGHRSGLPPQSVNVARYVVREKLPSKEAEMNSAEVLISRLLEIQHGHYFQAEPGQDLAAIRYAQLYIIGNDTHQGGHVIMSTRDKDGKDLGSFITGIFTFPCEK